MAAKTRILKSISISYLALISLVSISESTTISGLTTDLIHRDSPLSPYNDHSSSPSQRLINALKRSIHRARRFNHQPSKLEKPEPDLFSGGGEYMIKFSIGTPPVPTIAIADTGSDIVWTQCQPCLQCFNQSLPFFRPRNSVSYTRVPCSSPTCSSLRDTHCSRTRRNCLYSTLYGDGSATEGMFATENFTFPSTAGKSVVIPNIVFGCGSRNSGLFSGIESGIVGLGGGKASLVRQLGSLAQGKFSYCLVPYHDDYLNSSKLSFGGDAKVSGRGVVTTPLVVKKGGETYYFVTMEGISVGTKRIEFYDDSSSSNWRSAREGNIVIDSGTTLTLLPESLYAEVKKAVKREIKLKQINDPSGVCDLCFETRGEIRDFPQIRVHLRGGDLNWGYENAFVRTGEDSVCLAATANNGGFAIYGNLAQANFFVGYDLVKRTVSFKPAHCGRS